MAVRVGKLNYNQGKVVGRGSSGIYVFRGFLGLHENDRPVAVKRTQRGPNLDESLIQPEVELMKKANDHPNILRYIRQESDSNFL